MSSPRKHHYSFAHQYLPELVFKSRDSILPLLREGGENYLLNIWYQLGSTLEANERLAADGLALAFVENECYCGVIIALPKALQRTEVHLIALLGERVSGSILADDISGFEYRNLRYFTLEYGMHYAGKPGTVLGEWTYRRHSNYGVGPAVDARLFLAACMDLALPATRMRFHKDTSTCESRFRRHIAKYRSTENLLRFCHPAFWTLGNNDD